MLFSRLALAAAVLAIHGTALAHDYKIRDIEIDDAWVRATAPGQSAGGGYMEIENEGTTPDQLIGIKSDAAGSVSMHQTVTNNGVSTMREVDGGVTVPAKGEVKFAPGGYHIMFEKLKAPFKEGMEIPATLTFRQAGEVEIKFKVKPLTYKAPSMNGNMNHGGDMGNMSGHMSH
ncbi:MAG TPA: copper chaperone PCu(A)C [Bordetella sp.]|jgi:copper(I)-binding protein|nr:copper chaperone PCu(A)C [Bordetella sp.]